MNKENVSQMAAFDNPLVRNDEMEPINPSKNTPEDSESDEKYDMRDEEDAAPPRGRVLFIDADACPVTSVALACARDACTPVVIVGNTSSGTYAMAIHAHAKKRAVETPATMAFGSMCSMSQSERTAQISPS